MAKRGQQRGTGGVDPSLVRAVQEIAARARQAYGPLRRATRPHDPERLTEGLPDAHAAQEMAELFRRVEDEVGDGRLTAVLIAASAVAAALREGTSTSEARNIAADIRRATQEAAASVETHALSPWRSRPEEVLRVAVTAALGDKEIGQAILDAVAGVGPDGVVSITRLTPQAGEATVHLFFEEGSRFPVQAATEADEDESLDNPLVFVSTATLSEPDLAALLDVCREASRPWVCLCGGMDPRALELVRWSGRHRSLPVLAVLLSGERYGLEMFHDVAALTGATLLDNSAAPAVTGLELRHLGSAERVALEEGALVIEGGAGRAEEVRESVERLRAEMGRTHSPAEREDLSWRLARLTQGVAEVFVGGPSEEETERLYELACSALQAAREFIVAGGVPGGGTAYLWAANLLLGEAAPERANGSARALAAGLEAPLRCLLEHSELAAEPVLQQLRGDRRLCFDLETGGAVSWPARGPLEAARIVETVIRYAGDAATHLLELGVTEP